MLVLVVPGKRVVVLLVHVVRGNGVVRVVGGVDEAPFVSNFGMGACSFVSNFGMGACSFVSNLCMGASCSVSNFRMGAAPSWSSWYGPRTRSE